MVGVSLLQRNEYSEAEDSTLYVGGRANPGVPMTDIETGTAVISTPSPNPRLVFNFYHDACSPKGC
jgi:hypothetical protein